jgi:hypothetical protein
MREHGRETTSESFDMQFCFQVLRATGAVLGIIAMIMGLVYATRLFAAIFAALRAPESCQTLIGTWSTAVGGDAYHCAQIVAIAILGGGATLLAWLSLGLVWAGAKTVSWTLSDREAVKKMLERAFGPARKPEPNKPSETTR